MAEILARRRRSRRSTVRHACHSPRRAAGREVSGGGAVAVVVERPAYRRKGDVVPGDLVPAEESDLKAFGTGGELGRCQVGAVDDLHLADARDIIDGEQSVDGDA